MWIPHVDELSGARGLQVRIDRGDRIGNADPALGYEDVIRLWGQSAEFRTFFIALLAEVPYNAFRWETPPITEGTAERPFEFVALDSPQLAGRADSRAFVDQFQAAAADADVLVFPNLGHDATLVVPVPVGPTDGYCHLASFVRGAPPRQQHALWQRVGQVMSEQLDDRPLWLSTSGAGVPWLHVRLDSTPKYYAHAPYRNRT